jgi:hypothetical protein
MAGLADIMNDQIVIYRWADQSYDAYGRLRRPANYLDDVNASRTYKCRVQAEEKIVRDPQGQEIISTGVVYILGQADITLKDVIELDGKQPKIVSIDFATDENGLVHHTVVRLADGA